MCLEPYQALPTLRHCLTLSRRFASSPSLAWTRRRPHLPPTRDARERGEPGVGLHVVYNGVGVVYVCVCVCV